MFLHKLASFQHNVISHLLSLHLASDDVLELYCTYDITISSKPSLIKRIVIAMFENYAMNYLFQISQMTVPQSLVTKSFPSLNELSEIPRVASEM